jgi:hypothetical protein
MLGACLEMDFSLFHCFRFEDSSAILHARTLGEILN